MKGTNKSKDHIGTCYFSTLMEVSSIRLESVHVNTRHMPHAIFTAFTYFYSLPIEKYLHEYANVSTMFLRAF